jgi:hypothetical protein
LVPVQRFRLGRTPQIGEFAVKDPFLDSGAQIVISRLGTPKIDQLKYCATLRHSHSESDAHRPCSVDHGECISRTESQD